MLNAKAWKATLEKGASKCVYWLQVNGVDNKNKKHVLETMSGWNITGSGYNPKTDEEIIMFSRDFQETSKWIEWAKSFKSFKLVELDKNGEIKKYLKIGSTKNHVNNTNVTIENKRNGKRKCGKCGQAGHNARTCRAAYLRNTSEVQTSVKLKTSKRKCGKCGQAGHNARTCKK